MEILTPLLPKKFIKSEVIMLAMAMLTRVLPAKMVVKALMGFSRSLKIGEVFLPSWASLFNFMESSEKRAVSEAEKNAEKNKKIAKRRNFRINISGVISS